MQSEHRLRSIERLTNLPLLLLAFAMIPLLLAPVLLELSPTSEQAVLVADWLIWGVFAADFGIKVAVAPQRARYVRTHWIEACMVLLPMLRPIRILRFVRAARLLAVLGVNANLLRSIARHRGTQAIVAAVVVLTVGGAALVLGTERQAEGANITSFGDALWWSATTITTVGYGDHYPTTPAGRGVAVALMIFGIAALSALTATIAAMLVREDEAEDGLAAEVAALRAEIAALRTQLRGGTNDDP